MNMIENHLEQVSLSATTIAELPFPPPKIFTNALLHPHDITALIRDTEGHERALFTLAAPDTTSFEARSRKSVYQANGDGPRLGKPNLIGLKTGTAVGRILGGDIVDQIRKKDKDGGNEKNEVDVEALLKGAEKLCAVYPVPGALEKIATLRGRHAELAESVAKYESLVVDQAAKLSQMNLNRDDDGLDEYVVPSLHEGLAKVTFSLSDLRREEEEVRELEEKKRVLEERVSGMERDLGGLLR